VIVRHILALHTAGELKPKLAKWRHKLLVERLDQLRSADCRPALLPAGRSEIEATETPRQKDANARRNRILQGGKKDALAAIAEADLSELRACQAIGLKGDWRRAALAKRIGELSIDN